MIRVGTTRAVTKENRRERSRPSWLPKESFETQLPARNDDCIVNGGRCLADSERHRKWRKQEGQRSEFQRFTSQPSNAIRIYFAMQTFFGSVKKRSASSPPSRPTPICFMPPKGTRRSRTSQQLTQTVPVLIRSATRWARLRFWVQTLDERPYSTSLAQLITSSSLSNGVIVMTGPKISSRFVRHETDRPVMTVGWKKYPSRQRSLGGLGAEPPSVILPPSFWARST